MIARAIFTSVFSGMLLGAGTAQNQAYQDYIEQFKAVAVSEMERTGIPASIKMAQALLESDAGRSDLAREANNHFGIKCGSSWEGKTFKKFDDERNAAGLPKKSCFRNYRSAQESFIAHSEFLRPPNRQSRYSFLFDLEPTDYKGWARGLKKAGYATSPTYHKKLIDLIEQYRLDRLDRMTADEIVAQSGNKNRKPGKAKGGEEKAGSISITLASGVEMMFNNDARCLVPKHSIRVDELAGLANADIRDLLRYNEHLENGSQMVEGGSRVYLQPKRKSYRGRQRWHATEEGETMIDISTRYGISLDHLYRRNRIGPGTEPRTGSKIKIRGSRVKQAPDVYLRGQESPERHREAPLADDASGDTYIFKTTVEARPASGGTPPQSGNPAAQEPGSTADPFAPAASREQMQQTPAFHTVQQGDTLWSISRKYATTVDILKTLNGLDSDFIRQGMQLKLR